MKIQLLILIFCVVATFALAQSHSTDEENQNKKRESDNTTSANRNNKSTDDLTSLNDPTTESSTRSSWAIRREQNAKRIHLFKHAGASLRRNNSDSYIRLREHRERGPSHIFNWQRRLDGPLPAVSLVGNKQHVHHHHTHRTTTTATTTTSSTPISEMEEVLVKRRLMTPN